MAKAKEKEVKLPKGVSQEEYDKVKEIIVSGFENDQKPDVIKAAMFEQGIPFSKLTKLYSEITKAEGLVIDPKIAADKIEAALKKVSIKEDAAYADLEVVAEKIATKIQGVTASRVINAMKKLYKENEVEFPRKPAAARGKMGIINKTIIDVFKKNKDASQDELEQALAKVTKTLSNANDYAKQYHKMAFALAHSLSSLEVLTHFSADKK